MKGNWSVSLTFTHMHACTHTQTHTHTHTHTHTDYVNTSHLYLSKNAERGWAERQVLIVNAAQLPSSASSHPRHHMQSQSGRLKRKPVASSSSSSSPSHLCWSIFFFFTPFKIKHPLQLLQRSSSVSKPFTLETFPPAAAPLARR